MSMPVQIGAKAHTFAEPTGLLSDCHRRIEMFLATLEAVARVVDRPPVDDVCSGLQSALRYFAEAAPKHTADEEESLFPRLRRKRRQEIASVLARLEDLERDHRCAGPLHDEVERLGRKYLATGALATDEVEQFRKDVAELTKMYKRHIHFEDTELFPLAARILTEPEKSAVADEMAGRRNLKRRP
ncbi:MAG TPA: hemerythrin domain-containing protein [Terriglobales bacterium]|nr:hemerythrin domain-containing protein [Terriglobales bacterium]